tara:strand:- start:2701 stop:3069 length:369 start_codon:yes stop_codon:yes gene_type:complete
MTKSGLFLLLFCLIFHNCRKSTEIDHHEALGYINNDNYYFLDVRTMKEHNSKSIPNTDCIPVQEIKNKIDALEKYKDKKIIVYCRSGNRSGTATRILIENGFNAYNLIGGMNEWQGEVIKNE